MKNRFRWYLMALVLLAALPLGTTGWLLEPRAHAQHGDAIFVSNSIIGLTPGQAVRISVANRANRRTRTPLFFQCKVLDQDGAVVFLSERIEVPAGTFRFKDIVRRDMNVAGEPATDRVQARMEIFVILPHNSDASQVMVIRELLNEATGETFWADSATGPVHLEAWVDQDG